MGCSRRGLTRSCWSTVRVTSARSGRAPREACLRPPRFRRRWKSSTKRRARLPSPTITSIDRYKEGFLMPVWQVALVLNLTLAVGLALGYAAWGRRAEALDREFGAARVQVERLERERAACAGAARIHPRGLDPGGRGHSILAAGHARRRCRAGGDRAMVSDHSARRLTLDGARDFGVRRRVAAAASSRQLVAGDRGHCADLVGAAGARRT